MSYSSRVYRQRNPHAHDEGQQKPFFSGQHEGKKPGKNSKTVQAKLAVNKPGDSYEQEADAVANTVVNQPVKSPVVQQKKISSIQRLSTPAEDEQLGTNDARMKKDKDIQEKPIQLKGDEPEKEKPELQKMEAPKKEEEKSLQKMDEPKKEEEKPLQKMEDPKKDEEKAVQKKGEPDKEEDEMSKQPAVQKMEAPKKEEEKPLQKMDDPKKEEEKAVQKKGNTNHAAVSPVLSSYIDQSSGKGSPLPSKTLQEMNSGFGVDFSKVRIHKDQEAIAANSRLEAQAFTHGNDVYFNEGKFDPETASGKFLLAHELTHVVQQGQGSMQKNIKRQPAQPAVKQQVPGFSTPVPGGLQPSATGEYITTINGAKVIIRPDRHSRKRGKGAETNFKQSGGQITNIKTLRDKVISFNGPDPVVVIIQTTYQRNAKSTDTSVYGRGTTQQDIAAGDTSLGFHEGNHGTDYMNYLATNALPVFSGATGMTIKDFEGSLKTYTSEMKKYFTGMSKVSEGSTDCVGTTIDQLKGTDVCVP